MGGANLTMVGVMTGYKAMSVGVAFRVKEGASGAVVVRPVTIGTTVAKGGIRKGVFDSPTIFKPRPKGLAVSRLYIGAESKISYLLLHGLIKCAMTEGKGMAHPLFQDMQNCLV
jgi:hypothetical protein